MKNETEKGYCDLSKAVKMCSSSNVTFLIILLVMIYVVMCAFHHCDVRLTNYTLF